MSDENKSQNEQGDAIDLIWIKITMEHHVRQNLWQIIKHTIDIYSRNHEDMNISPTLKSGMLQYALYKKLTLVAKW